MHGLKLLALYATLSYHVLLVTMVPVHGFDFGSLCNSNDLKSRNFKVMGLEVLHRQSQEY